MRKHHKYKCNKCGCAVVKQCCVFHSSSRESIQLTPWDITWDALVLWVCCAPLLRRRRGNKWARALQCLVYMRWRDALFFNPHVFVLGWAWHARRTRCANRRKILLRWDILETTGDHEDREDDEEGGKEGRKTADRLWFAWVTVLPWWSVHNLLQHSIGEPDAAIIAEWVIKTKGILIDRKKKVSCVAVNEWKDCCCWEWRGLGKKRVKNAGFLEGGMCLVVK